MTLGRLDQFIELKDRAGRWHASTTGLEPCPQCDPLEPGWTWVTITNDHGAEYLAAARCTLCWATQAAASRINECQLPSRYNPRECDPRNSEQWEMAAVLDEWREAYADDDRRVGLRLAGSVGCGKSHWMAVALARLCVDGVRCRYTHTQGMLAELRDSYRAADQDRSTVSLSDFCSVPLLGLDELTGTCDDGFGWRTDWELEVLMEVISLRYERRLPTIATSNLDRSGLTKLFGGGLLAQRLLSRMEESMPECHVIGPDVRVP